MVVRWLERIALLQLSAILLGVHVVAVWVWQQTGVWPRYKAPTSWSVPPISNHQFLYQCILALIVCNLFMVWIVGTWSLGRTGFLLTRRGEKDWRAIGFYALMLAIAVVFVADPVGALFWFAD